MGDTNSSYAFLKARFAQISKLNSVNEILNKDAEAAMAAGSMEDRVQQQVAISETIHLLISDPKVEESLNSIDTNDLPFEDARNFYLMKHRWVHEAGLPADLAAELGRVRAEGEFVHTNSYGTNNWASVREWYRRSFDVAREAGQVKQEKLGLSSPYEALLDHFSPGMRFATVDAEFRKLDKALRPMIAEALDLQAQAPAALPLAGPFSLDLQATLNREMAAVFGFDFNRGVHYAIKGHPSMGGSSDDARITTRLDEFDLVPGIYATIHETGHAVYEQNMPKEWRYQPAGSHMHIHESQSMIMEYQAAMTPEFFGISFGQVAVLIRRSV